MSSNLYWMPLHDSGLFLPRALKHAISHRYFGHDGSLGSDPVTINESDLPYFQELEKEGVEGASEVVKAIGLYGEIEIWTSH